MCLIPIVLNFSPPINQNSQVKVLTSLVFGNPKTIYPVDSSKLSNI